MSRPSCGLSVKATTFLRLGVPLLSDADERVLKLYGLLDDPDADGTGYARPAVLLLDAQGVIRWAMFTENFRVRVHPDALLAAIAQLPASG